MATKLICDGCGAESTADGQGIEAVESCSLILEMKAMWNSTVPAYVGRDLCPTCRQKVSYGISQIRRIAGLDRG